MTNTLIRWLLGPAQRPILDKAKTFTVTGVSTILTFIASQQFLKAIGVELTPEQISAFSLGAGAVVAGFLAEVIASYRKGGTKALQELLNVKYGLKLKSDDWFGPVTQKATEAIIEDEIDLATAKRRPPRRKAR
jgi:hypothetical protein